MTQERNEELDLHERLQLIETMIAEGRHSTESWGWTFLLWGVAYYIAIAWASLGQPGLAWPVTMIASCVVTAAIAARKPRTASTTIGRAIGSIWVAVGVSLFAITLPLGMTGRLDSVLTVAVVGALLGCANAASSMILRWRMQFAAAVVWWAAGIAACFMNARQAMWAFLAAIFFCQIVFGIYAMAADRRRRAQRLRHA
jgi:hypothetical protein